MYYLHDLIADLPHAELTGAADVAVRRVTADSRLVEPEDVFVAVRGTAIDGHDMVVEAVERGATVIIGDRHIADLPFDDRHRSMDVTYVRVANSRRAHAHLIRATDPAIRQALQGIRFYGVTGTNGKTTVATVLEQALLHLGVNAAFFGTTGYRFAGQTLEATHTTPDVDRLYSLIVQAYNAGVTTVVMEVSSHALDQERVDGIPFHAAVFTNLTRDHLDYHETMEQYAKAKQQLFTGLAPEGIAVLNGDDAWSSFMKRGCAAQAIWTVGCEEGNRARIRDQQMSINGCSFTVDHMQIQTPLVGAFNVMNTALCAMLLLADGYPPGEVRTGLANAIGPAGRMEQYRLPNGALAIVDYAHTPDALENALTTLAPLVRAQHARLHVVFGCGGDRDKGKRPQMGSVAAAHADQAWVTSDNPRTEEPSSIIDDILAGIPAQIAASSAVQVVVDRRDAIRQALAAAAEGDVVLIAGKGHETYQVVGTEKHHFSDAEVVLEMSNV